MRRGRYVGVIAEKRQGACPCDFFLFPSAQKVENLQQLECTAPLLQQP